MVGLVGSLMSGVLDSLTVCLLDSLCYLQNHALKIHPIIKRSANFTESCRCRCDVLLSV